MKLRVLAVGTRMPSWINSGFDDYAGRLKGAYRLELIEIPLGTRTLKNSTQAIATEGAKILAKLAQPTYVVALEVTGRSLTTEQLAAFVEQHGQTQRGIAFCIGGPDGLAPAVTQRANFSWSLSALTLPHGLARVIVAEALYRAVSVINHQPYHRA